MSEYPQKDFYRLNEVCQYTDTQPYVLRFWESEFPQLNRGESSGRGRLYRKSDIDLVQRIKRLLYEEECTLAEARAKLEEESLAAARPKAVAKAPHEAPPRPARPLDRSPKPQREVAVSRIATALPPRDIPPPPPVEIDTVARNRYQDALDEIDHLRLQIKEENNHRRKAENALQEATAIAERRRDRMQRAIDRLEQLLERLG